MRVLVTGGAGYIGSHAVYKLLDEGFNPVVIDNLSSGFIENIPSDVPFYNQCLSSFIGIKNILMQEKIDAVFHFAASISAPESINDPLTYYKNNTFNTANLLKAMIETQVFKLVFSSTAAVYGDPKKNIPIKEVDRLSPMTPYGQSKLHSENIINDLCKVTPLNAICLRYFNVAGADDLCRTGQSNPQATHLIKKGIDVALNLEVSLSVFGIDFNTDDGTGVRDYIHVSDLIDIHILALKKILSSSSNFKVLNCGYGKGFSVYQIVNAIETVIGKKIKINIKPKRDGDSPFLVANSSELTKYLNWNPKRNEIQKIIQSAYNWQKSLMGIKYYDSR